LKSVGFNPETLRRKQSFGRLNPLRWIMAKRKGRKCIERYMPF